MSKRRVFSIFIVLAVWLVVVLPLWVIGLGYEARGFRLPTIDRDRLIDVLIFYGPIAVICTMLIRPVIDRFRVDRTS